MKKALPLALQLFMFFLLIASLIFTSIGVRSARAATIWTVTSIGDNGTATASNCPHASNCRLRDAIAAALAGDTIVFAGALSGQTIRLTTTLTLSKNLIIDGSALASKITISGDTDNDGAGNLGVFYSDHTTVTINSLIITKGVSYYGAGIYNDGGTLTVKNSIFSNNTGIGNGDYASGGAIRSTVGTLTITDSTFFNNSATYRGGAIHSASGILLVKSSSFSGNNASEGGAIHGGGTIANSTFSGNYASYGGAIAASSSTIKNSTFAGNIATSGYGGGFYGGGTIHFDNNIIANSTGTDCQFSGTFITNTNNLVEDGSCAAALSGDPKLGALANNGGPTQTMALMAGSPAINAGNATVCSADPVNNLDQRGITRSLGGRCDIGAYESHFSIATYTSTGAQDGWVLESTETSNQGLTTNSSTSILFLGDNGVKKQYRGILSFNTSSLPDTAVIASVMLKAKQQSIVGGGNPVAFFQGFMVDIKLGTLGTAALQPTDFQTSPSASYGPFAITPVSSWYNINLTNAKAHINKLSTNGGMTQIRLRFKLDDNNNSAANYLSIFSGNAAAASKPQLVIYYYVP